MSWRFVLADRNDTSLGELQAHDRTFNPGVSQTATATGRIRQDDPLWPVLAAGDSNLKVYDSTGALQLYGPVVSDEEQADGVGCNVRFVAADQSYELSKRYFAKDPQGVGHGYYLTDTAAIIADVLAQVNAERACGIVLGNVNTFVPQSAVYLFKRALDALSELGAVAGSYEWGLRYADGVPVTTSLDMLTRIGSDRSATTFLEYGTGKKNCKAYGKVRSIDQQATRVWGVGGGTTLAAENYDAAAETRYAARREDVVTAGDIYVYATLVSFAAAQVTGRKDPPQVLTLTPFQNTLRYGVDYMVGDTISARVVIAGRTRVASPARIYSSQIAIDDVGNEIPQVTLVTVAAA